MVLMHSSYIESMDLVASSWTMSCTLPRLPSSSLLLGTVPSIAVSPARLYPLLFHYGKSLTDSSPKRSHLCPRR